MFLIGQSFFYQPEAQQDFIYVLLDSPWSWLFFWLLLINLITFFTFGVDKWKARRKEHKPEIRRIPERTLFLCAILGGSLGAFLGMRVWHHKTKHRSFQIGIPAILILQLILLLLMLCIQFT